MTPTLTMSRDGEYKPGLCSVLFVVLGEFFFFIFKKNCILKFPKISK